MNDLLMPSGYVSRAWMEEQYHLGRKQTEQFRASVTRDQVEARLSTLSAAPGGVGIMAKELRSPLLRESLYESRVRQLAVTYKLSQGESAQFNGDIAVGAAAIGVDGLPAQIEVKSNLVQVDTRLYTANPYCRWNQSNQTKYDILNSIQQRAKASLMLQEALAFYRLIKYASGLRSGQGFTAGLENTYAGANGAQVPGASTQNAPASVNNTSGDRLTIEQLSDAVAAFGARLVDGSKKLWINPSRVSDLNLFNIRSASVGGGAGFFAPQMMDAILRKGSVGEILGMEVISDIAVPYLDSGVYTDSKLETGSENIMGYILGPAENVGVIVVRTDLSVETMKDANRFADVFALWQDLGMYSMWTKAMQRLTHA